MDVPTRGIDTTEAIIQINWTELALNKNGGDDVDSYNLRWDQSTGVWVDLVGEEGNLSLLTTFTISSGIVAGNQYKFTVRAHNSHGFGPESEYLIVEAASAPERPDPPTTAIHNHFVKI